MPVIGKPEHLFFDLFPRVVRAGSKTAITIRPRHDHCRFQAGLVYPVSVTPAEGLRDGSRTAPAFSISPGEGSLAFEAAFPEEQEYVVLVGDPADGGKPFLEFRLYALREDLFRLRPYKGDFHLHSTRSDGREGPAYVAAAGRKIGMDFLAITDHRLYAPSLEAIRALEGLPTDFRMYPGEEVHAPDNPVHIVNFGARRGITELFTTEEYAEGVRALQKTLPKVPEALRGAAAASIWCFRRIREEGGLAVFCHPYWFYHGRYDVPTELTALLMEMAPFDALELIGGYHLNEVESNALQVLFYNEERARGRRIPIVGASDSHGCERNTLFGWYYTIVFSPSPALPDVLEAVKDLRSVAVEALPSQLPRAHGPMRLAQFSQFLLRAVFPDHDAICGVEGQIMLEALEGDPQAAQRLSGLRSRPADFLKRVYGS